MSFLLRNEIGRRKPLASRPNGQFSKLRQSASNFPRREPAGLSGERQSMVQIHRPQTNIVVKNQQEQMQSLSMKEVMSDLQILHEQQQEGQRQLDQSRLIKQRRVEQYAACEEKLRKLNYQHGQDRAYQKDLHEKLSIVQRLVGSAKLKASKSNKDIDLFERMLHRAIETKRRLLSHHRGNRLHLVKLRETLNYLKSQIEQRHFDCQALQIEYEKVKSQDKSLRQSRDDKILMTQKLAGENAPLRAEHMKLQNEIDEQLKASTDTKAQMMSVKQRIEDTATSREAAVDSAEKLAESHKEIMSEMDQRIKAEQSQNKMQAESIKLLEREIATLKLTHVESTGINDGTQLDLSRIQESIEAEKQSLVDEQSASQTMKDDIVAIRTQLSKIKAEIARTQKSVAEKKEVLKEAKECEELRREEYKKYTDQLELKRNEISDLEKTYEEEKAAKHQRTLTFQKEKEDIETKIANNESHRAEIKQCIQVTVSATRATEVRLQEEEQQSSVVIDSWKEKLDKERKRNQLLCSEVASKKEEVADLEMNAVSFDADDMDMSSVEYKAAIAQLINEHPILQGIRVTDVFKDGDFESQVKQHLRPVFEHCDDRIKSARKMSRALRASAKRKEEEYQQSKKAAEAEEERQRRHREKRKKRLEAERSKISQLPKKLKSVEKQNEAQDCIKVNDTESTAQPRVLLSAFTRAGDTKKAASHGLKKTTVKSFGEIGDVEEVHVHARDETAAVTSSSGRKVHWGKSKLTKPDNPKLDQKNEQKCFGARSRHSSLSRHDPPKHNETSNRRDASLSNHPKTEHLNSISKDRHLKSSLKSIDRIQMANVSGTKGSPTVSDLSIEGGKFWKATEKIASKNKDQQSNEHITVGKQPEKQKTKSNANPIAEKERGKVSSTSRPTKKVNEKAPDKGIVPEKCEAPLPMYIDIFKNKENGSSSKRHSSSSKHQSSSSKRQSSTQPVRKVPPEDSKQQETRPRAKERKTTDKTKESSKRSHGETHTNQTTGIPSTERPSKSRRRVRAKSTSASKITLQSFKNDVSFNFADD